MNSNLGIILAETNTLRLENI